MQRWGTSRKLAFVKWVGDLGFINSNTHPVIISDFFFFFFFSV